MHKLEHWLMGLISKASLIARFMGQHGAHLGPTGPRWAPCWPYEPYYLGCCDARCVVIHFLIWLYFLLNHQCITLDNIFTTGIISTHWNLVAHICINNFGLTVIQVMAGRRQFNSLGLSDAKWRWRSKSTLVQVMVCCLTAPSLYLNQCWLIISKVLWHSSEDIIIWR